VREPAPSRPDDVICTDLITAESADPIDGGLRARAPSTQASITATRRGRGAGDRDVSGATAARASAGGALLVLSAGQFLMALDTSVMNVSMATVARDLGSSITGIQAAITLYTLVMASFMVTGGTLGARIGRRRAFAVGCVVYGAGSLTTALAPNLAVLLIGWSLLEGAGAVLILPAIVALVAGNFSADDRPKAYGTVAAAGAIAVAVGPLVGGATTTYLSWRWVFASEVVLVAAILALSRRIHDVPTTPARRLDLVGAGLSALGIGLGVLGVLRASVWGWFTPRPGAPDLLSVSLTFWCVVAGLLVLWAFSLWENHLVTVGREPLIRPALVQVPVLRSALALFGFQFLVQAGVFFVVPLFLSVVLELSALGTGLRILPLSLALLVAALGVPRAFPHLSPRRAVRIGVVAMTAGIVVLVSRVDVDATAAVVAVPMVLLGLGIGVLASQLGAVAVSSVGDEQSGEVGGLQNTATNLGASIGTALAGSVLIAALTQSFLVGIERNPDVPKAVTAQAQVSLASGAPFLSDTELAAALDDAGVEPTVAQAISAENRAARVTALRQALATLVVLALLSLFFTRGIPQAAPGGSAPRTAPGRHSG
jgi:MFS family permease